MVVGRFGAAVCSIAGGGPASSSTGRGLDSAKWSEGLAQPDHIPITRRSSNHFNTPPPRGEPLTGSMSWHSDIARRQSEARADAPHDASTSFATRPGSPDRDLFMDDLHDARSRTNERSHCCARKRLFIQRDGAQHRPQPRPSRRPSSHLGRRPHPRFRWHNHYLGRRPHSVRRNHFGERRNLWGPRRLRGGLGQAGS